MSTEIDTFSLRLTEHLRDDMLRILSLADNQPQDAVAIAELAKHSLRIADAFLLAHQQTQLPLEPLAAASILEDVAHDISLVAKMRGVQVRVDVRGTARPILAHRQSMRDLLNLVASAVLSQQPSSSTIVLGTHRSARGTVVGAFASEPTDIKLRSLSAAPQTSSAEVLLSVAARLGERLQTQVKNYRHASVPGFGATFNQSSQLQLLV